MKIVAAGGGSGGHVTPVLAVLSELKRHDPNLEAFFITDRAFATQASAIMATAPFAIPVKRISAGKLRRYHKVSILRQTFNLSMVYKNTIDIFKTGVGFVQSLRFLARVKPDVVFTKGGYVCLPVGLAAKALKIPIVIHDSDAHPGLTNRVLSKYAAAIATGAPLSNYPYPKDRSKYVGIPVGPAYKPVTAQRQQKLKAALGLPDTKRPLIFVTGGGLGARSLNHVITTIAKQLLPKVSIVHLTGENNYQETLAQAPEHPGYIIKPFFSGGLATAFGAADVVVTRAGATTLGELASMAKPIILIPSPYLASGHQLKNAEVYAKAGAAVVLKEQDIVLNPLKLRQAIVKLLTDSSRRRALAKAIYSFAKPDATIDVAAMIVEAAVKSHPKP